MYVRRRLATRVWASVLTCLVIWLGGTLIGNATTDSHFRHAQAMADQRAHFYQVIAGQEQAGSSVADGLAVDLRNTPGDRLRFFSGDSNTYGGVTQELGVDPFRDTCGVECGPLTSGMLRNVREIRSGHVDQVIRADRPRRGAHHSASLIGSLIVVMAVLGVLLFLWPRIGSWQRTRSAHARYSSDYRTVEGLDEVIRALPPGDRRIDTLHQLRTNLCDALDKRSGSDVDDILNARIERLVNDAQSTLVAYRAGDKYLDGGT